LTCHGFFVLEVLRRFGPREGRATLRRLLYLLTGVCLILRRLRRPDPNIFGATNIKSRSGPSKRYTGLLLISLIIFEKSILANF
jgi:hypothetical protein